MNLAMKFTVESLTDVLRGFYLSSAIFVLSINAIPILRPRLLVYGARKDDTGKRDGDQNRRRSWLNTVLDTLTSVQVPHEWFAHFYVVSLSLSFFWAVQYGIDERMLHWLLERQPTGNMTVEQVYLVWTLMVIQGARRLFESVYVIQPSKSQMWIVHWLLGVSFYAATSVGVWVEGAPALREHQNFDFGVSRRSLFGLFGFVVASMIQYQCHSYLATLPKYSVPEWAWFRAVVCPHYTAECAIYLSLAAIAAPVGQSMNRTVLAALVFVTVNLGVTAETTRAWYESKFGQGAVQGKWRMIPGLY